MSKSALTFYEVTWSDSETDSGWDKAIDIKFPSKLCISYGYFVKQSDLYFTIAADYDEENNMFNRFIHIPKVNIKRKRKVKI